MRCGRVFLAVGLVLGGCSDGGRDGGDTDGGDTDGSDSGDGSVRLECDIASETAIVDEFVASWQKINSDQDDACTWTGIKCEDNCIVEIDMQAQFNSSLPVSIGQLSNLRVLRFPASLLTGPIPQEYASLTHLRELDLSSNAITGELPVWITSLEVLNLNRTEITGISADVTQLSNLRALWLQQTNVQTIPDELWDMTSLERLDLRQTGVTGVVPSGIGKLTNLTHLHLSDVADPLPAEMSNLTQLQSLVLERGTLSGPIPAWIWQLQQLKGLDLSQNAWSGSLPDAFGSAKVMTHLNLSNNQLTGSIPNEIGTMSELYELDLSANDLSGSVPPGVPNARATYTKLSSNQLSGELPIEFIANQYPYMILALSQNGCLTAGTQPFADWLDREAPGWDDGCE